MADRLATLQRAARTVWAFVALSLLLVSLAIAIVSLAFALRSSRIQVDNVQAESTCRARSAISLDNAEGERDDVLAELQETIGRLFAASIIRDTAVIQTEGAKLSPLSDQIHSANEAIRVARDDRLASVDRCALEN